VLATSVQEQLETGAKSTADVTDQAPQVNSKCLLNHNQHSQKFKVNSAEHCSHCTEKTKRSGKEREKRCVISLDLNVDSVVDDVTSGGREFHVRDADAGKARSSIVRRRVEGVSEQFLNGTSAQYRLCSAILLRNGRNGDGQ